MWFIIILGIIAFLAMEHFKALVFVFLPLGILFVLSMIGFFKGRKAEFSGLIAGMVILGIMLIALLVVCSN